MQPLDENIAVFTLRQIVDDKWPILHALHDDDGEWQFLSGEEATLDDLLMVQLKDILTLDPSVRHVLHIARGYEASRDNPAVPWITMKTII